MLPLLSEYFRFTSVARFATPLPENEIDKSAISDISGKCDKTTDIVAELPTVAALGEQDTTFGTAAGYMNEKKRAVFSSRVDSGMDTIGIT